MYCSFTGRWIPAPTASLCENTPSPASLLLPIHLCPRSFRVSRTSCADGHRRTDQLEHIGRGTLPQVPRWYARCPMTVGVAPRGEPPPIRQHKIWWIAAIYLHAASLAPLPINRRRDCCCIQRISQIAVARATSRRAFAVARRRSEVWQGPCTYTAGAIQRRPPAKFGPARWMPGHVFERQDRWNVSISRQTPTRCASLD